MHDQDRSWSSPWLYRYRASPTFILVAVSVTIFNDVFLFGTIVPILPYALPSRVHVDYDNVQIYISVLLGAYGGAQLIGSLLFGWIGDRLRRRHAIFLFGLGLLMVATFLLAFGRRFSILLLGRLLQGLAASITWTSGLALLNQVFGPERRGEAMGYTYLSVSVGTTSAPLLGGLVYSKGGYGAVSAMSIFTVAVALVLTSLMIEPTDPDADMLGNEHTVSYGSSKVKTKIQKYAEGEEDDEAGPSGSSTANDSSSDLADESTSLLGKGQSAPRRFSGPTYLLLLRSPRILAAIAGVFTYSFVLMSMESLIPLYVKDTFHWDSAKAALTFLCWIIPGFLSPLSGKMSDRLGSRWPAAAGLLCASPPLILLRLVTHESTGQKVLLCAMLTLIGLFFILIIPACQADLSTAASDLKRERPEDFGDSEADNQSYGLFVCAWSGGSVVGPPCTGVMKTQLSWGSATLLLACICICASIPIMFKTSSASRREKKATVA